MEKMIQADVEYGRKEKQRVVVFQDVSRQLNPNPIRWALTGLLLKPGDKLTLVGVLHEVITPSTLF